MLIMVSVSSGVSVEVDILSFGAKVTWSLVDGLPSDIFPNLVNIKPPASPSRSSGLARVPCSGTTEVDQHTAAEEMHVGLLFPLCQTVP